MKHCFALLFLIFVPGILCAQGKQQDYNYVGKASSSAKQEQKDTTEYENRTAEHRKTLLNSSWGISCKAGTLGIGGEIVKELSSKFSLRIGVQYFSYAKNFSGSSFSDMRIDLNLLSFSLLGDWYFIKWMHITGGLMYNLNHFSLQGTPNKTLNFGTYTLSPDELGRVDIKFHQNPVNPYLGIGFGRPIALERRISFNTDIGFLYTGSPVVDEFSATGLITPTGSEENRQIIEQNLRQYMFYPVLSFQLTYKFIK